MATVTKTITLVPSGYTGLTNLTTNSSYPVSNGYDDSSSTTYARYTLGTSSTGYLYYTFDTSEIPTEATITGVSANFKARVGNTSRVTNSTCQLYTGTTAKGSSTAFASTTASVRSMTVGSWTRTELNDLRLRIGATGSSSTSTKRFDFYGADVTVTYTVAAYTVSASGDGTLDPSGSTTVEGGDSYTLMISGLSSTPTVTDNGVDVTSQLTTTSEVTDTAIPNGNTNSGFTVSNITNAYTDADSDTYAQLTTPAGGTQCTLYLDLEDISIPSGAILKSVTAQATIQFSRNNSSSGITASCQLYSGSTAKGSATTIVSSATDVAKTTFNLTTGSWTASELANARFYFTATNNASSTQRIFYIYGVSFNVTYESDGVTYVYTLSNIATDHTIVVTAAAEQDKMYLKVNGSWVAGSKVYKKISGSWVEQTNLTNVFESGVNYKSG